MEVAIASGKGGTGKTMVATNLAYSALRSGYSVAYKDCDVEEPNGHIFLKPVFTSSSPVCTPIPVVDDAMCIHCDKCGEICRYSAIITLVDKVLTFPELCHSCGGCSLVCPSEAITEIGREIGRLEAGRAGEILFVHGVLNIGEVKSPALIKEVKAFSPDADIVFIDSPPGTSCPVIETVRGADYVLLVTEPTPFGLNDLELAIEMIKILELPFGVVVNRADLGKAGADTVLNRDDVAVLAEIPDDRLIAEAYSRGEIACQVIPEYEDVFSVLLQRIRQEELHR